MRRTSRTGLVTMGLAAALAAWPMWAAAQSPPPADPSPATAATEAASPVMAAVQLAPTTDSGPPGGVPALAPAAPAPPPDSSRARVEQGTRQIQAGQGQVRSGVADLAKGIGTSIVDSVTMTGESIARVTSSAWDRVSEKAMDAGDDAYRLWKKLTTW